MVHRTPRLCTGFALITLTLLAGAGGLGCKSSTSAAGLSSGCALNSDCDSPLVCVFARCHEQCEKSVDCPQSERCVPSDPGFNTPRVCELPADTVCVHGLCPGALACSPSDNECRTPCSTTEDCQPGQYCVKAADVAACYQIGNASDDPALIAAGVLALDGAVLVEGGGHTTFGTTPATDSAATPGEDAALQDATLQDAALGDATLPEAALSYDGGSESAPRDAAPEAAPFVPDTDAGALGYVATNFDVRLLTARMFGEDAGLFTQAPDTLISTAVSGGCSALGAPGAIVALTDPDATQADLCLLKSLIVDATASVVLTGPRPIVLAVLGTVDIQGPLIVTAGGFSTATSLGPGGPPAPTTGPRYGGASYCGVGGQGATGSAAPGGATYGSPTLAPLLGGSAGIGNCYGTDVNPGGGALQISAGTSITIGTTGSINAGGGGGSEAAGASGGAILLESPTVTIRGAVAANGGSAGDSTGGCVARGQAGLAGASPVPGSNGVGGSGSGGADTGGGSGQTADAGIVGSGGGGAGRIRINTASGAAVVAGGGIISPAPTTGCATQGVLSSTP